MVISNTKPFKLQEALIKAEEQKRTDFKAGRAVGLSGREMFSFDPALAEDADDEDEAFDLRNYDQDDEEQDVTEYRNIELDLIGMEASEVRPSSIYTCGEILL